MTIAVRSKRNFIFAFRPTVSADAGFDQARGVGDPIKVERRCAAACSDLPRLLSGDSGALSRRAVARESDAREAEQHHCPGGGLGGGIISIEGDCPVPELYPVADVRICLRNIVDKGEREGAGGRQQRRIRKGLWSRGIQFATAAIREEKLNAGPPIL
jgi:hypothetical protein